MGQGYIKLHRQIADNWLWEDKPFSKGQAWIDLLLCANHKTAKVPLGNSIVIVERGSFITSEEKMKEKWGWKSKTKVRNFLKVLENEGMIVNQKHANKRTVISICNYSLYQGSETTEELLKKHKRTTEELQKNYRKTTEELLKNPNNNNNNDNNEKNLNNNSNSQDADTKIIAGTWAKEFQQFLTPNQHIELRAYLDKGIQADTIAYAIKEASNQNVKNLAYVQGILNSYLSQGILTVGQAEQAKLDYANKKKGGQNGKHESDGKRHPKQDTGDKKFEFDASKFLAPDLSNVEIDMSDLR